MGPVIWIWDHTLFCCQHIMGSCIILISIIMGPFIIYVIKSVILVHYTDGAIAYLQDGAIQYLRLNIIWGHRKF